MPVPFWMANRLAMRLWLNLAPKVLQERADAWPSFLPSSLVNLGLDLRGGAHLLAEVDTRAVYKSRMDNYWPELRNALAEQRDTFGGIRRLDAPDDQLHIRIAKIEGIDDALRIVRGIATPCAEPNRYWQHGY